MWPWANGRQRRQECPKEGGMAPACLLVEQASARNFSDSPKKPMGAVACGTCACRCLGAPVFGDAGAHGLHEVVNASDVVGSSQRTCCSSDRLGRLFWRCLLSS